MIDDDVRARVLAVHRHDPDSGAAAAAWLEELPTAVAALSRSWGLGPLRLLAAGLAVVAAAERDDGGGSGGCVLKLSLPGTLEPRREVHWLRRVAGASGVSGAVVLLDAEPEAGAQLLERVEPGTTLQEHLLTAARSSRREFLVADDAACDVIAERADRLSRPAIDSDHAGMPSLATRLEVLFAHERGGSLPAPLVATAVAQARHLLAGAEEQLLLHGDLHHANVLLDARGGWTVIDPHGVVGEAAYDLACAVYNPFELDELAPQRAVARCGRLAAASGLPPDRVRGWALVQAVLSAVWFLDSGADGAQSTRHVLGVAERLAG